MTKEELEAQLADMQAKLDAVYGGLVSTISKEADQAKAYIATLEAKILQLQNQPSIPVDFTVDLAGLKGSIEKFSGLSDSINALIPEAPVAPVTGATPVVPVPPVVDPVPPVPPVPAPVPQPTNVVVTPAGEPPVPA